MLLQCPVMTSYPLPVTCEATAAAEDSVALPTVCGILFKTVIIAPGFCKVSQPVVFVVINSKARSPPEVNDIITQSVGMRTSRYLIQAMQ